GWNFRYPGRFEIWPVQQRTFQADCAPDQTVSGKPSAEHAEVEAFWRAARATSVSPCGADLLARQGQAFTSWRTMSALHVACLTNCRVRGFVRRYFSFVL